MVAPANVVAGGSVPLRAPADRGSYAPRFFHDDVSLVEDELFIVVE
ncbi:hypothetical protein [Sorangium atrum]|uniref:Uncharacterized protein n=1 Tax=Sorangium atrum TaxID=2995308 RepID=A0ABT5CGP9_9BACT|nr:hypothetical protein [Sorangium aterium]MDC0685000.1 hypothetical protein [Sorangium aterium]